ncbi:hypothetical protein HIM_03483 [Hirsutella minnesotensis 3608]|uniref:FHA domain-containing protein n=1 Tax=Hirsutella minnesotensis 3608 TaxID=1043627 RepID=A0A0F8A2Q6_9HYPO|nr:hypothetical protein HIM_03483 [Hirsutella minnesotensis 3608]
MTPAEPSSSRSGRWRDDNDHGRKSSRTGRRDEDDRRDEQRRHSRNRHERRRSRTPDSTRHRHRHHRQRDSDNDGDRDRGRRESPRGDKRRRRSRHDTRDGHPRDSGLDSDEGETSRNKKAVVKHRGPLPSQQDSYAAESGDPVEKPKEKPNWGTTGVLAAASNSVAQADGTSITLKYHEPAEARKPLPRDEWKLFVFKGNDIVDTIDLNSKSCWLVGRDSAVVDILAEHPSISKQHAVIQFRYTEKRNEFGDKRGKVKPYLLDLESANRTTLNDADVPASRYLELRHKDMVKFGHSSREYVVMLAPRT